ncbi:MAG: TRAP transporter small permease [Deltaproteobacteria bacterium]|nr:TRAP transporter small permease [Deltaproteobacteria bacterium]
MLKFANLISHLNRLLGAISGFIILIVCFFMVADVIARRILGSAILWVGDINRYLLLCIIFFAVALTLEENGHVKADILIGQVKNTIFEKIFSSLAAVFSFGYCGVLLWKTIGLFLRSLELNMKTSSQVSIPMSWLYIVIIFGSLLLVIVILLKIIEAFAGRPLLQSSRK